MSIQKLLSNLLEQKHVTIKIQILSQIKNLDLLSKTWDPSSIKNLNLFQKEGSHGVIQEEINFNQVPILGRLRCAYSIKEDEIMSELFVLWLPMEFLFAEHVS